MKLAVCFSIYNGLELLEPAVKQWLFRADIILLCYQTTSNKGEYSVASKLMAEHFATKYNCHTLNFAPDLRNNTKKNELDKHNMMLQYARGAGATHLIMSATDHFYTDQQFNWAISQDNADVSFTKMYTYYKHPTWQLTPMEDYYMPFLIKINPNTAFMRMANYPVRVDPSLQINTSASCRVFDPLGISMHHYSMVRKDILNKFKNAAASIRWSESQRLEFINEYQNYDLTKNPGVVYFGGRKIRVVDDYFKLSNLW